MKKLVFLLGLAITTISCSSNGEYGEYTDKIKLYLKTDEFTMKQVAIMNYGSSSYENIAKAIEKGVKINYKSVYFQLIDTLTVKKQLADGIAQYERELKDLLDVIAFSEEGLTKEKLIELRNWENKQRAIDPAIYKNSAEAQFDDSPLDLGGNWGRISGLYFGDIGISLLNWRDFGGTKYKNFEEFAFANRDLSPFISDLCNQIEKTDKLLTEWDNLGKGNLELIRNAIWYYQRQSVVRGGIYNTRNDYRILLTDADDNLAFGDPSDKLDNLPYSWFCGNGNNWECVIKFIDGLEKLQVENDRLSEMDANEVMEYKALNTYTFAESAKVDLKYYRYFIFDKELNIIRSKWAGERVGGDPHRIQDENPGVYIKIIYSDD